MLLIKKNKKYNKSNPIYNRLSFYSYSDDRILDNLSFKSKYLHLPNFYDDSQKLIKIKQIKLDKIKEKNV